MGFNDIYLGVVACKVLTSMKHVLIPNACDALHHVYSRRGLPPLLVRTHPSLNVERRESRWVRSIYPAYFRDGMQQCNLICCLLILNVHLALAVRR